MICTACNAQCSIWRRCEARLAEEVERLAYRIAENPRLLGCELCGGEVEADATLMLCPSCRAACELLGQIGVLPCAVPANVHTAQAGSEKARAQYRATG